MKRILLLKTFLLLYFCIVKSQPYVVNGVSWYDQNNNPVNAHGAGIVQENGRWWLFGEYKSDTTNAFPGFACYSSTDLCNWNFERVVLSVQKEGILSKERIGERVKVMRCPSTGDYIMLMHTDNLEYRDPCIGIATSKSVNGDYKLLGGLTYKGEPIKKWDMGTFQDDDGKGYLLIHHGPIYRLSDDYLTIDTIVADVKGMGESPAMFKKDGIYYLLTSHLTSWERNDNYYFTAQNIAGPWTKHDVFCPEGTLTYNSQSTFVLILPDGTPMYMGDRWSYPKQASCATYVWLPLETDGEKLFIPDYWNAWNPLTCTQTDVLSSAKQIYFDNFTTEEIDNPLTISWEGQQIAITGEATSHSGYAQITISLPSGKEVFSTLVDFYAKVNDNNLRFISPQLPQNKYVLTVSPTLEHSTWTDKKRTIVYGSDGQQVNINGIYILK